MKVKKIKIRIESEDEFFKRIGGYMKRLDKGERKKMTDESLSVSSLSQLKNILTEKRLEILSMIRKKKPDSVYSLAKMLDRRQENVQSDVKLLSDLGFIDIKKDKKGRKKSSLKVDYDVLDFSVPIVN